MSASSRVAHHKVQGDSKGKTTKEPRAWVPSKPPWMRMPPHAAVSSAAPPAASAPPPSAAAAAGGGQDTAHHAKLSRFGGEWAPVIVGRTHFATASADPPGPSSRCKRTASLVAATPSVPPVCVQRKGW